MLGHLEQDFSARDIDERDVAHEENNQPRRPRHLRDARTGRSSNLPPNRHDADQLALQQSCGEDAERGGRDCYREFLATEAPDATRA
ncbi:MAG TPA: hypothetical protein VGG73_19865 [Vicinamibacterales bacterium]|jgi:hypothetical protein